MTHTKFVLLQIGSLPVQLPVRRHCLRWLPLKMNPSLQVYVADEPTLVPSNVTSPLRGPVSGPQSLAAWKNQ